MKKSTLNLWVESGKPDSHTRMRLFCFPYAGAGASVFRAWKKVFPDTIALCPVQLPGRENRIGEPAFRAMPPLIDALAEAIYPALDLPFAFFGHSMGSLIAFELTRYLHQKYSMLPVYLFVSGHSAPQLGHTSESIHDLPDADVMDKLKSLNGTPQQILQNKELMQLLLPLIRADFELCEKYVCTPGPPFATPIAAFGGLNDTTAPPEDIQAWDIHTTATCKLHTYPGDHFFLFENEDAVLQKVLSYLHGVLYR